MSRKWKISLFSLLFVLLIFVVTACDNKSSGGNQDPEWGEWVVTKAATCTEEGVETRTAKNDSTKTETRAIQKKAHTPGQAKQENVSAATCTVDGSYDECVYCTVCQTLIERKHHTTDATGHLYHDHTNPATCEHAETITYTCENCGDHYDVTGSPKLQHQLSGEQVETTTLVEGETCKYKVVTTCTCETCKKDIVLSTNYIYVHDHKAAITTPATCTTPGVITYTCAHDNDTYTVATPINKEAHTWVAGTPDPDTGITVHTCSACHGTKSTFSAKDLVEKKIDNAIIQEATEIELKNATIAFDNSAKEVLGTTQDITIKADTVDTTTLELDDEMAERIGDNTVFDFTCQVGDDLVSNFGNGKVKVTVPYTLSEGEDPNRIAIWYLADDGSYDQIDAIYSDGFVTFETSHFSKYVVVKLTPEELCEKMGLHNMVFVEAKDASCTEYGQIMYACTRCGHVENELTPMIDHDFDIDHEHSLAPTYDAEGYTEYACRNCDATMRVIIPKKPRPADNRIQNLINSLFEDDYFTSVEGLEQLANVTMANSQIKLTEDGNIYMISKAKNQETDEEMISIVDMNNGLAYSISESGYSISTASMNFDLNKVKKTVYAVTELIPTDLGNMVLEKALPILFDVEATDTEVTLTFNMDKLLTIYDNLLNKTIGQNVDILIGEGTTALLTILVDGALDMTVSELMTLLEGMGITVDSIAELTKEFNNGKALFDAEMIKPFITAMKDMKVLDVINMAIPMIKRMMESQDEQVVEQEETGPLSIGEGGTTTTEPENPTTAEEDDDEDEFTPITKKQIMDGLTGILAMKVTDLVAMFVPNAEAIIAKLPTKEYLETLTEDLLDLKITLNNKYQFKKLEAEVKFNETIKTMAKVPAGMDVDITAVIEHQNKEDLFDVQQKIKEVKDKVVFLDITLDNHDWYIEALNEYLDTTGNNGLTYTFTKNQEGYQITSSKFDVPYQAYNSTTLTTIKAYYVIIVGVYDTSYKYINIDDDGNYYKHLNVSGSICYVLEDEQVRGDYLDIPNTVCYNPTTKKYSLEENSYYGGGFYKYEKITYEEYIQKARSTQPKNDNCIYYKRTNVATSDVDYSYSSIGTTFGNTLYVLTDAEFTNQSQVAYPNGVKVNYYMGIGSYSIYYNVTANGIEYDYIQSYSHVRKALFDNGLRAHYGSSDYDYVNQNVNLANFKIIFSDAEVIDACCSKVKVQITVNGVVSEVTGFVYDHQGESTTTQTTDGCYIHYETKCSECNRVLDSWDSESHDLEFRYIEKAQGTMPGIRIAYCKNCNYIGRPEAYYCYHNSHGTHTDEDGNVTYECNECHYTWSGYENPVIFLEQVADEDEYKIRYQLIYFKDFNDFSYTYNVAIMIGVMGEDGEYVMTPLNEVTYIYGSEVYREYENREFSYTFFSYNKSEVEEALDELDLDDEYVLFIAVTSSEGYAYMLELN